MSYKVTWQTICKAYPKYFNIVNMPKKRLKKDKEEVQEMKGKKVNAEEQVSWSRRG